ncbi:DUF4129 domain-containing protein [Paenibacillus thermotolerans]|uniref:DUF4129 domain-containing protein n=1 Tax=Paenibacillus thermotolerans TaxID=3027807 RepID=UPI002367F2E9|nr:MULTISPECIES: DUF4129 domain-containing protein [unclassified Paenibacillus]
MAKGWAFALLSSYDEEKEALKGILSGDEYTAYAAKEGQQGENLLLRWLEELVNKLNDLFPQIEFADGSEDVLMYIIIGIGVVIVAALLFFLWQMLWFERGLKRKASMTEDELEQPPESLLERARNAAESGDTREGTRLLFLALLLSLQEKEMLEVRAWKTNWEYAEELAERSSPWLELFRESALRFDTVWYGLKELPSDDFRDWYKRVESSIADGKGEAA